VLNDNFIVEDIEENILIFLSRGFLPETNQVLPYCNIT
jgi:hypothetical protein